MAIGEWLEGREATALLCQIHGRPIHEGFVRDYACKGKVRWKRKQGYAHINVYHRDDVQGMRIRPLRKTLEKLARAVAQDQGYKTL